MTRTAEQIEAARQLRELVNSMGQRAELMEHMMRQCLKIAPTAQSRRPGVHALAVRARGVVAYMRLTAPLLQKHYGAEGS